MTADLGDHVRRASGRLLLSLGVFDPVRAGYQRLFNRAYRDKLKARQRLYENFVRRGDRVFDLGANRGEFSLVFRRIGAEVIAVEPNPRLAEWLRRRFPEATIVEAAIGSEAGQAELFLGRDSNYSTVSERWKPVVEQRDRLSGTTTSVEVTTLDALVATYGVPTFAKVDVEGNELEAFLGLNTALDALVFEFQCPLLDDFEASIEKLEALAPYEFGLDTENGIKWHTSGAILRQVRELCERGTGSGDVFARRRQRCERV